MNDLYLYYRAYIRGFQNGEIYWLEYFSELDTAYKILKSKEVDDEVRIYTIEKIHFGNKEVVYSETF